VEVMRFLANLNISNIEGSGSLFKCPVVPKPIYFFPSRWSNFYPILLPCCSSLMDPKARTNERTESSSRTLLNLLMHDLS
jgi:hypothetical protein